MNGFVTSYGSLVFWAIAIVGWGVANTSANRRECRKELRSDVDAACALTEKIADLFSTYCQTQPNTAESASSEVRLKLMFKDLGMQLHRLSQRKRFYIRQILKLDASQQAMDKFYVSVTGGNFESSDRQVSEGMTEILTAASHSLELIDNLKKAFNDAF
jgi:hypothetical protein